MLWDWGAIDGDGQFVHRICGASVPRQSGKSWDTVVWSAFLACQLGMKVLYTAHTYDTAMEMRDRIGSMFGMAPDDPTAEHKKLNRAVKSVNRTTSQEDIRFKGGGGIWFSTRSNRAKLGKGFDIIVYDEAQMLTDEQQQVISPTAVGGQKGNPQKVYIGTPPHAGGPGDIFEGLRNGVLAGAAESTCWWEWSVEEIGDVHDESRWWGVNPSLGRRTLVDALRSDLVTMKELEFAQEYLGYWLPAGHVEPALPTAAWQGCEAARGARAPAGKSAYGVKFSPDGTEVALAAAVEGAEGIAWVELVAIEPTSRGTRWLADWLRERADACLATVVDGRAGADALVERVRGSFRKRTLLRATTPQVISAASGLRDAVLEGTVTWYGPDGNLDSSARGTPRRRIGRDGGWGFGGEDSAPIEAAALALWAARSRRASRRKGLAA